MLRRYCPPNSNIAAVNCPSEQYFVASISMAIMFIGQLTVKVSMDPHLQQYRLWYRKYAAPIPGKDE